MGTVIDDRHAATEFKPLFEVLLPSVYNDSIATAVSQQSSREDKALSRSRKSNQKAGTSSSGPKRHHSQATPERKAGSAEADQPIKNRWTCAALSSRVPGIFMGHANGQVWHWHAAAVPAAEVLQDQGNHMTHLTESNFSDCVLQRKHNLPMPIIAGLMCGCWPASPVKAPGATPGLPQRRLDRSCPM